MKQLRFTGLYFAFVLGFFVAVSAAVAQVPQPAAEPGSMPEAQPASPMRPSTQSSRLIRVSGGVMASQKLSGDVPVYPVEAKEQGVQGAVVLHTIVGADGHVQSLTVVSGSPLLVDAAMEAVKTWVYSPFMLNGNPTAVDTVITVNFNLAP